MLYNMLEYQRSKLSIMPITCDNCGYKGLKSEFRFLNTADSAGIDVYRQCPKCHCAVYSEELEEEPPGIGLWGATKLRGQVFKGRRRDSGEKGER